MFCLVEKLKSLRSFEYSLNLHRQNGFSHFSVVSVQTKKASSFHFTDKWNTLCQYLSWRKEKQQCFSGLLPVILSAIKPIAMFSGIKNYNNGLIRCAARGFLCFCRSWKGIADDFSPFQKQLKSPLSGSSVKSFRGTNEASGRWSGEKLSFITSVKNVCCPPNTAKTFSLYDPWELLITDTHLLGPLGA